MVDNALWIHVQLKGIPANVTENITENVVKTRTVSYCLRYRFWIKINFYLLCHWCMYLSDQEWLHSLIKVRLHDTTKLMRHATCNKIALCKRAYLCDMQLLHAVAGKLKSSNFLATIACRNKPVYIVRFWRTSHVAWSHVFVASCKRAFNDHWWVWSLVTKKVVHMHAAIWLATLLAVYSSIDIE